MKHAEEDPILQWMIENHIPLTVRQYVALNWWDVKPEDLEEENLVEVEELVREGKLRGKVPRVAKSTRR